jgi:hypothetical protein
MPWCILSRSPTSSFVLATLLVLLSPFSSSHHSTLTICGMRGSCHTNLQKFSAHIHTHYVVSLRAATNRLWTAANDVLYAQWPVFGGGRLEGLRRGDDTISIQQTVLEGTSIEEGTVSKAIDRRVVVEDEAIVQLTTEKACRTIHLNSLNMVRVLRHFLQFRAASCAPRAGASYLLHRPVHYAKSLVYVSTLSPTTRCV